MKIILIRLLIITPFLFSGCVTQLAHYYYQQNPPEVSLFTEKNEARISGYISNSEHIKSKGMQSSYSITDKFCLAANWNSFSNSKSETVNGQSTGSWTGNYYEGAFGYYKDLKKSGVFEVYCGFGNGNQQHKYVDVKEEWVVALIFPVPNYTVTQIGSANFNYNKYFVQPSYGFSFFNCFDMALYLRGSCLDFYYVKNDVNKEFQDYNSVKYIKDERYSWMFEPGLLLRAGYKFIKFQTQFGLTGSTTSFNYDSYYFSVGAQISFSKKYFKAKKKETEKSGMD